MPESASRQAIDIFNCRNDLELTFFEILIPVVTGKKYMVGAKYTYC